eukprot:3034036-Amphidinium_carterae.1
MAVPMTLWRYALTLVGLKASGFACFQGAPRSRCPAFWSLCCVGPSLVSSASTVWSRVPRSLDWCLVFFAVSLVNFRFTSALPGLCAEF